MHTWGDDWPHWDDLREAEHWIYTKTRHETKCHVIMKEKYGSLRYEHIIPPGGHLMMHKYAIKSPLWTTVTRGKHTVRYKKVLWSWSTSWLYRKWVEWAWKVHIRNVKEAVHHWPHLKEELMDDLYYRLKEFE